MTNLFSIHYLPWLMGSFCIIFISREFVAYHGNLMGKYLLTPMVTISIIGFVICAISLHGIDLYRLLILMSLLFALVADTILMIVEVDLMKFGIVFFLLGHIGYIAAFSADYYFEPWNLLVAAVFLCAFLLMGRKLRGRTGGLGAAVLVYMSIICIMSYFAISGLNYGFTRSRVLIAIGAVLFAMSDSVLAVNAFLRKIPHSTVVTWSLYGPAQLLIALSCFH